jgi:GntR family transcriptional regulator, transcriptional repressor for pyruvate dehydrogenase complex
VSEKQVFARYRHKRAFDDIAEQIKESILKKRFKIGERLPSERALAEQFGVGRLTIREAIRNLEAKGFVKVRKGCEGGALVGITDPETVASMIIDNLLIEGLTGEAMIEARIGLQCAIAKAAVQHATEQDLDLISSHLEECRSAVGPEEAEAKISRMIAFHLLVAEASHNLVYVMFMRALMEWARRRLQGWVPSMEAQDYSYISYKKVFDALKQRNADLAEQQIEEHIRTMGEFTKEHIERKVH